MATYLVTLATGQQGRYTVQHLLSAGASINAVVRNPTAEAARTLEESGAGRVKLFKGELTDLAAYKEAAKGASGIFLNLPDPDPTQDVDAQYNTTKAILNAVKEGGVKHVVASSASLADLPEKWDNEETKQIGLYHYFKTKSRMDDAVRESGLAWTILHPAWLMGNYLLPGAPIVYPELVAKAELAHALAEGKTILHTDEEDVGRYAAAAFADPAKFSGKLIDLGNEDLTMEQVAQHLSDGSGKLVTPRLRSPEEVGKMLGGGEPTIALIFEMFASQQAFTLNSKKAEEEYGVTQTTLKAYFQKNAERLSKVIP